MSSGISDSHTMIASGSPCVSAEPKNISSKSAVITMVLPDPVGAEKEMITCSSASDRSILFALFIRLWRSESASS